MVDKKQPGFSLVELLVAISFIAVIIILILTISYSNNKLYRLNQETTRAMFYASEAMEAVKMFSWDELSPGAYSVSRTGDTWTLAIGSQLLDNRFTRLISISDVYRTSSLNGNVYGDIVTSGGFLDPDTKKVNVLINWPSRAGVNRQEQIETYLYRWQADRWTQNDWSGGAGQDNWNDTAGFFSKDAGIDATIAGILTLKSGFLNWSEATTTASFDTPGNFDDNDVYEVDDVVYLVTENNSSGSEFYILDVSDLENPWQMSSLNIGASVTSVVVKDGYAYLSTYGDDRELVVIDVSDPYDPDIEKMVDISGNSNAYDLVVDESELYIVKGSRLYSFSILDPSNPAQLDYISVDETARELYLSEDYVYIATEDYDKELQIIDVTNPANLSGAANYNLPGSLKATDINVRGDKAYISTQNNSSGPEFFIFDITDPSDPVYVGDYNINASIYSFAIIGPYALLGPSISNEELTVIDVSYPATINYVAGFDLEGYVLGMSANCSVVYAATSGNQGEFFIISTEVPDCGYADLGILESATFDTGSDQVAYNWIAWTGSEPLNTDIRFQIATSANQAGPWNFVGPDGTSSTYYSLAATELINYNHHLNQRYIRYKLFLTSTAGLQVPTLEDITISYSSY